MILRSLLLRLSQVLASSLAVFYLIMFATAVYHDLDPLLWPYGLFVGGALLWVIISHFLIRSLDIELVAEVARLLYPLGALLSIVISIFLSMSLHDQMENPRYQHLPVVFAGVMIALFLLFRMTDIRWLRGIDEIRLLEPTKDDPS